MESDLGETFERITVGSGSELAGINAARKDRKYVLDYKFNSTYYANNISVENRALRQYIYPD
jgi:hypothetical protein